MNIKELQTKYPKLSLKKICDTTNLCYQYLLKASKKPIANEAYDPTSINYDEMNKIVNSKKVDLDSYDWEQIVSTIRTFEPINKIEDFELEDEFKIRGSEDFYKVIYKTSTHIVFQNINDTQPRVMNWETFLHQSPRIYKNK